MTSGVPFSMAAFTRLGTQHFDNVAQSVGYVYLPISILNPTN